MYKDILEKFKVYKTRIIKSFIEKGVYPSDTLIRTYIDRIDLSLPLLEKHLAESGDYFETSEYNEMIQNIFEDLTILYHIIYELTVEDYTILKAYADTHLNDLEKQVNHYLLKASEEVASTSLGKTLYFASDSFDAKTTDSTLIISLGDLNFTNGSRISCFITGYNLTTNILFKLIDDTGKTYRLNPYNYNNDIFEEPHTQNYKMFTYDTNNVNYRDTLVPIELNELNENHIYYLLGAKDKITIKQFGETTEQYYVNAPMDFDMMGFTEKSYIDFYVLGGTSISFRMNKAPITSNYQITNTTIQLTKPITHFFISCDANFAFDFALEGGTVYASYAKGVIKNHQLYYPYTTVISDFLVIDYDTDTKTNYKVYCEINNNEGNLDSIQSIYIKELNTLI